jgi:transposase
LDAYNHDKPHVEEDFRTLKASDLIRIQPIRHWTDSKIRVYALICVLALLVLKLLERTARDAGLTMSPAVLKTELEDIQQIYLEMSATTIQRVLTTRSTIQQQLFTVFDLNRYAPQSSAAVPLHLANG